MAVAVIKHAELKAYAEHLGFPLYTKLALLPGGVGYLTWDKWIRENVEWVSEVGFNPAIHVKITESAQLTGQLKNPWELKCQKFLEGDSEHNTFKPVTVDEKDFELHVNRKAIQIAVSTAELKYKVEYETESDGSVVTHNRLAVAIFDRAEDTSISYQSDVEVAQLWTTRVTEEDAGLVLWKRAYSDYPDVEESYPWIVVGAITEEEYALWKIHSEQDGKSFEHLMDRANAGIAEEFS